MNSYWDGPAYVEELRGDLVTFSVLLDEVERFTYDARVANGVSSASAEMVFERAEKRMLDLQRRIERVLRSSEGDIYRLKWLRSESECRDLQRKLKDCYVELNTMVTVISAYVVVFDITDRSPAFFAMLIVIQAVKPHSKVLALISCRAAKSNDYLTASLQGRIRASCQAAPRPSNFAILCRNC